MMPEGINDQLFNDNKSQRKQIIGYFPSWGIYSRKYFVKDIPFEYITKILYAFIKVGEDGTITFGDQWADVEIEFPKQNQIIGDNCKNQQIKGNFSEIAKAKKQHPHIETAISIGGWTGSKQFHSLKDQAKRQKFIKSIIDFLLKYEMFDSVDIDWEHPNRPGDNNPYGQEDTQTLTSIVKELKAQINVLSNIQKAQNHRKRNLTLALSGQAIALQWVQYEEIHPYVDAFYMMTYDYHGAWDLNCIGHNSPIYYDNKDPYGDGNNIDYAVKYLINKGVPREKICIGSTFYGRSWQGVFTQQRYSDTDILYQQANEKGPGTFEGETEKGVLQYYDINNNYMNKNQYKYVWDKISQSSYLYNGNVFISFDSTQSIEMKCKYIQNQGLGGLFFWDLPGDTRQHELVKSIAQNFREN